MNEKHTQPGGAEPRPQQTRDSSGNSPPQERIAVLEARIGVLEAAVSKRHQTEVEMWLRAQVDVRTASGMETVAGIHIELADAYRRSAAFRTSRAKIVLGVVTALAISGITMLAQYIPHQVVTWLTSQPKQ